MYFKFLTFIFLITLELVFLKAQSRPSQLPYIETLGRTLYESEIFTPAYFEMSTSIYNQENWPAIIDSVWGPGLPTAEKLAIFDLAFEVIDTRYAAFQNLVVNIDSLRNIYRPEIEAGVSRGRFAAIMNHFTLALMEIHTVIMDIPVSWGTPLNRGIPLLVIGPWGNNARFGACLTPLPDSTLLVYRALPGHTLGLVAGDIVLGYNGIPWKILYKELLAAELPIHLNLYWGSNDRSMAHCILSSAGLNWHLFNTIDIIKHGTGDTLHLPTNLLENQTGTIWGNEQLPIPGVPQPNIAQNEYVGWGMVDGTQIGYVYVASWNGDPQYGIAQKVYNAVDSIMHHIPTTGMIMDFRINYGGGGGGPEPPVTPILRLLFNTTFYTLGFDQRCGNTNHFSMCPDFYLTPDFFRIHGDPSSYYDKPIALLTGPAAASAGDVDALRLSFHPKAKFFGKPSCGAFCNAEVKNLLNPDWYFYLSRTNAYLDSNHQYLAHTEIDLFKDVWLTQQGVINGVDDVAQEAIAWINQVSSSGQASDPQPLDRYSLSHNYPNPFNPITKIDFELLKAGRVTLKIFNILGEEVATLLSASLLSGQHSVQWNASKQASGVYLYRLEVGDYAETGKMILMR